MKIKYVPKMTNIYSYYVVNAVFTWDTVLFGCFEYLLKIWKNFETWELKKILYLKNEKLYIWKKTCNEVNAVLTSDICTLWKFTGHLKKKPYKMSI